MGVCGKKTVKEVVRLFLSKMLIFFCLNWFSYLLYDRNTKLLIDYFVCYYQS